jgi:hypothetical protein
VTRGQDPYAPLLAPFEALAASVPALCDELEAARALGPDLDAADRVWRAALGVRTAANRVALAADELAWAWSMPDRPAEAEEGRP